MLGKRALGVDSSRRGCLSSGPVNQAGEGAELGGD